MGKGKLLLISNCCVLYVINLLCLLDSVLLETVKVIFPIRNLDEDKCER